MFGTTVDANCDLELFLGIELYNSLKNIHLLMIAHLPLSFLILPCINNYIQHFYLYIHQPFQISRCLLRDNSRYHMDFAKKIIQI